MHLLLYQWKKDPSKYLVHLDAMGPLFAGAETFGAEWVLAACYAALNPLTRPLPAGSNLYVATNRLCFPYNTTSIARVDNLFYPSEKGVYFIADDATISELKTTGLLEI